MDPVQRIPRYTLMFRVMIKHMAPGDPQRKKLVQADEIASKIALAEADEQTKQAAIWYCLSATVDGFPPGIISNSRRYIDCIDVEDVVSDPGIPSSAPGSSSSTGSLHCTLFLFDDKLVIAKRPGNGEKSGRALTGLDEMEKLAKAGSLPVGMKKSGMTFKGVVDIADVVAADVGVAGTCFRFERLNQCVNLRYLQICISTSRAPHKTKPIAGPVVHSGHSRLFIPHRLPIWIHLGPSWTKRASSRIYGTRRLCVERRPDNPLSLVEKRQKWSLEVAE
jgi:hypothetical protein